jgi:hypothetical protein
MFKKAFILISVWLFMVITTLSAVLTTKAFDDVNNDNTETMITNRYSTVLSTWKSEGLKDDSPFVRVIHPSDFILRDGETLLDVTESHGYRDRVFYWNNQDEVTMRVDVENTGLYEIYLDYYSMTSSVVPIEISITINDEIQYFEANTIALETLWRNETNTFNVDRYGNDVLPRQIQERMWMNRPLRDTPKLYLEPLKFKLNAGENTIKLTRLNGSLLLGDVTIKGKSVRLDYDTYLNRQTAPMVSDVLIKQEAEIATLRNSPSIRPGISREVGVKPFALTNLRLNVLSSESYRRGGQRVDYDVTVPQTGLYQLTFKSLQAGKTHSPVYRTLYVNGDIPFKEAEHIPFYYSRNYQNVTLEVNDKPMYLYLTEGVNTISLEVDASMYRQVYEDIQYIMEEINDLT